MQPRGTRKLDEPLNFCHWLFRCRHVATSTLSKEAREFRRVIPTATAMSATRSASLSDFMKVAMFALARRSGFGRGKIGELAFAEKLEGVVFVLEDAAPAVEDPGHVDGLFPKTKSVYSTSLST